MTVNTTFMGSGETSLIRTPGDVLQTALNVDVLTGTTNGWFDAGPYTSMNVTLIGGATITAGAVTFEQTNDPTSAGRPLPYRDASSVTAGGAITALTVTSAFNQHYIIPITARYVRIRISTAFTGTVFGVRAIAEMTRGWIAADMNNGVTATVSGVVQTANQDNIFWNETTTAQAISATVTGGTRDTGVAAGTAHRYAAFNAYGFADQAGTMRIEVSFDATTWRRASADVAVAANTAVFLSVPVTARYHRVVYVNGAVAQTVFMLNASYTVA